LFFAKVRTGCRPPSGHVRQARGEGRHRRVIKGVCVQDIEVLMIAFGG